MGLNELEVDFSFIDDERLQAIVVKYHEEALAAYQGELYAAALFLAGAALEGTLSWAIKNAAAVSLSKVERDPLEWSLTELINQAIKWDLLGKSATGASWAVKDFRNFIHPGNALKQGSSRADAALSGGALNGVVEIVRSLRGRIPQASSGEASSEAHSHKNYADSDLLMNRLNFAWLIPGQLAGCRGPRSDQDLRDLESLRIKAIVRLAHDEERPLPSAEVEKVGLRDLHEPVRDLRAPTPNQIDRVVEFIEIAVRSNLPVAVSCGAGYGRTSTLLVCYLVRTGTTAQDAIAQVKEACHREPEVPVQLDTIQKYEQRAHGRRP